MLNEYTRFVGIALGRTARFMALTCGAFGGLILIAAVEFTVLWLAGVEYTPKSAVWRQSLREVSVAAAGRWGVTCIRSRRKADDTSFEYELVLHDLQKHVASSLGFTRLAPTRVSITAAGDTIAFGCDDGSIYVCQGGTDKESIPRRSNRSAEFLCRGVPGLFCELIVSPDGEYIAAAGVDAVCLVKSPEGKLLRTWSVDDSERSPLLSFSNDSEYLLSYSGGEVARLWNTSTREQVAAIPLSGTHVTGIALSPSARMARLIGGDQVVRAWSFDAGEFVPCESWSAFASNGPPPVFSADGLLVASTTDCYTINVCRAASGERVSQFHGHPSQITGLAFGSDHDLYSWDVDGTVHGWKLNEQEGQLRVAKHRNASKSISFEPLLAVGL